MRTLVILTLMFALFGCQPMVSPSTENRWTRTELYFGQAIPAGGEISEEQWQQFVDEVVTPRFPDGLSVSELRGQWREPSGKIVRERSKLLVLFHPPTPENEKKIEEIRKIYKERFGQDSIMRSDAPAAVGF